MDKIELAAALNEWMRRYTEEPERFDREFRTVSQFLSEQAAGQVPSYGATCADLLLSIREELKTAA